MWFSKKVAPAQPNNQPNTKVTTKSSGDAAEALALTYLERAGLRLLDSNYRTPGRGGGEIDLIMKDKDGTLVFVEVRQRASASHGGAGASISAVKQRRIVFAARHYLMRFKTLPPCRFDVVLINGGLGTDDAPATQWLRSAFDAF
jgi:putative endonuclease